MKLIFVIYTCFLTVTSFVQFPSPYCPENFSSGIRPITRVSFNTINNTSPATGTLPAHEDFTTVSTNVLAGTAYTITVQGNTSGNWIDFYKAWFDWNGDGDFIDA